MMFWPGFARNDMSTYRKGYPNAVDHPHWKQNLLFYRNEIPLLPEGVKLDDVHAKWTGRYDHLEFCHSYIQWIFPIQEQGLNHMAHPLQKHEIATMRSEPLVMERVVRSYRMMLDFWGMALADESTGKLARGKHWESQFRNLNRSMHNYLRVTRMLKFLGEMGLEHYKMPFLTFCEEEIYKTEELENCRDSFEDYWVPTVVEDGTREKYLEHLKEYPKRRYMTFWERRELEEKRDKEKLLKKRQEREGKSEVTDHATSSGGEGAKSMDEETRKDEDELVDEERITGDEVAVATATATATTTATATATASAHVAESSPPHKEPEEARGSSDDAGKVTRSPADNIDE